MWESTNLCRGAWFKPKKTKLRMEFSMESGRGRKSLNFCTLPFDVVQYEGTGKMFVTPPYRGEIREFLKRRYGKDSLITTFGFFGP